MNHEGEQAVTPIALIHRPIRRPRTTFTGECMFAASWMRLMDSPLVESERYSGGFATKLESILTLYPHEITQRTASIAASFITWLGTNNGMCFLMSARKMGEVISNPQNAYVAAWAIENRRWQGINSGVRTIEAVLSKEDSGKDLFGYRPNIPILSAAEVEVVDLLVEWMAGEEGMTFVNNCEAQIESLKNARAAEEHRQMLAQSRKPNHTSEVTNEP